MVAKKEDLDKVLNALHFEKQYIEDVIAEVNDKGRYNDQHIRIKTEGKFLAYLVKGDDKRHVI